MKRLMIFTLSIICSASWAANPLSVSVPEADNSVAAEQASFTLAEGYAINLFADETDGIANPVCMTWDGGGRLWVLCTLAYPQLKPVDEPNDQLLVLEDTDRDGRADKTTVFADGLNMPTGFALGDGGAYIGEGQDLIHVRDTDGDGRGDVRRMVLTGFGTGDTHQNINSFTWSPGGELYFCQGLHCFSRVETPWGIRRLDEHGSWRLRPKRLQLDGYRRTSGGGNPWGIAFGHWGEPFVKSNSPGIAELLPSLVRVGYTPSFWGGEMQIGRTEIKSMILEYAESPHLPEDLQGDILIAGYFARVVDRMSWQVDGSGHKMTMGAPLIRSSHNAFRPVDIRVGPDGAIYVADWFNPIIGHYQASLRHPDRDKTHGRVWRVTANGRPLANAPNFEKMSIEELCEKLEAPWRYTRYQAKRQLADRPRSEVLAAMDRWIAGPAASDEHALYEALGVYESHEQVNRPLLMQLLSAKDPRARAYATRVVGRWHDRLVNPLPLLAASTVDVHPRVRLEAVVACSDVRVAESMAVAARVARAPMDRFIRYALTQATHALAPHWRPALSEGALKFEHADDLTEVLRSFGGKEVIGEVRTLLAGDRLSVGTRVQLMTLLVEIGTPKDLRWVLDQPSASTEAFDALIRAAQVRGLKPLGDLEDRVAALMASDRAAVVEKAIELAGWWELTGLTAAVEHVFSGHEIPSVQRAAAAEALARLKSAAAIPALVAVVDRPDPAVQSAVLRSLVRLDLGQAASVAQDLLAKATSEATVRRILLPFLGIDGGAKALASVLSGAPPSATVSTHMRRVLAAVGRYDADFDAVLRGAAGADMVGIPAYDAGYVEALAKEVREHGNAANGAKLYQAPGMSCVACHQLNGAGGVLGPALTAVGAGVPVELLIESILWPKRQIKEGYAATSITTKGGTVLNGYLQREDRQQIVLRDAASQQVHTVLRKSVAAREDAGSLMPPGLTAGLTRAELRDLVRYLSELR